jgi:hypothetical protein
VILLILAVHAVPGAAVAFAEDVAVETVLRGLKNPWGVAIRPGGSAVGFEVFVADTGAGRIVKLAGEKPGRSTDVITGFPTAGSGAGPLETSGPRGLLFLGRHRLLVIGGSNGEDSLRLYELPEDNRPLEFDDAKTVAALPADGGRLYGLARTRVNERVPDELIVTASGKDSQGWLGKVALRPGPALGEVKPFVTSTPQPRAMVPVGLVVSGRGFVVAGWKSSEEKPGDGSIVFYNPIDGASLLALPTTLQDVSGLVYSEETQNLYVCDLSADSPRQGGVYRIDDASKPGKPACTAVRIAAIERPTALAVGPDGALYVTACGSGNGQGVLVRITGEGKPL